MAKSKSGGSTKAAPRTVVSGHTLLSTGPVMGPPKPPPSTTPTPIVPTPFVVYPSGGTGGGFDVRDIRGGPPVLSVPPGGGGFSVTGLGPDRALATIATPSGSVPTFGGVSYGGDGMKIKVAGIGAETLLLPIGGGDSARFSGSTNGTTSAASESSGGVRGAEGGFFGDFGSMAGPSVGGADSAFGGGDGAAPSLVVLLVVGVVAFLLLRRRGG